MRTPRKTPNRLRWAALAPGLLLFGLGLQAQTTPILSFEFNEATADAVRESINGLTGTPTDPPPTMVTDTPSGTAGDRAINFEAGQYTTIDDPETKMQLDPANPSFTLQAWVKFSGNPSTRAVFFYSNGPGGAISFSVNTDRTVFVTTLGILDANSVAAIPDDGAWHHIAVVHENGVEIRYYVDGVLGDTRAYTSGVIFTRTQNYFTLGAEPGGGLQYVGSLDRLKVTSGVLTPDQFDSKPIVDVTDTDKDGMPDAWETKYAACCGLNPNDASDAAKDCNGNGITNLDEFKRGLDPCNTTKPTVVSAASTASFNTVLVTFSEPVDAATAEVTANYTITPALAVTAASAKGNVVTLTTAAQTPGGTAYTVTVKGVKNASNWEVPEGSNTAKFFTYMMTRDGILKFSFWGNISGTAVQGLYDDPRYPATPDWTGAVFSFNSRDILPTDANENYGATMAGYLTPTESGDYRFFIYSDDASQLFLSADQTPVDPLTSQWIAEEPGCCNNFSEPGAHTRTSEPISLVAGKKYYILMVYKEGGGGDYGQVAWRKEGDPTPAASLKPIPGKYLSAAEDLPAPAEGSFVTQSPAPNAKNVKPNSGITIAHRDGKSAWTAANTSLKVDGVAVPAVFTKDGNTATLTYQPPSLFASASAHTLTVGYPAPDGTPANLEWSFEITTYSGPVKDVVKGYPGLILGAAKQTDDKGGFSGKAGDRAIDLGKVNAQQSVLIYDASFLNAPAAADKLTFTIWAQKYDIADNSVFWADSPSSSSGMRGFQAHLPWSNNNIYFDTVGCCDAATQRLNAGIDTFAGYSGDVSWWNQWRHYAFVKDGSHKQIYVDGQLFLEGDNTNPLPTDFARIWLGAEGGGPNAGTANNLHGLLDDFAVFGSALTESDIAKLAAGNAPTSLGAAANLVAYWPFNELPSARTYGLGLNFGADEASGSNSGTLAPTAVAGASLVAQANWNNLTLLNGTSTTIVGDAAGASQATAVTVSWTSANTWASTGRGEENNQLTGADKTLMTGYLDTGAASTSSVTIQNLPEALTSGGYDVYVYLLGGVPAKGGGYRILDANSGAVLKDYVKAQCSVNPTAHVQAIPTATDPGTGTYVLFSGLASANIKVEATTDGGLGFGTNPRAPINAIQLVAPASSAPPPSLSATRTATGLSITFTGKLQSADNVAGPYTDVAGATSPAAITASGAGKFYRSAK